MQARVRTYLLDEMRVQRRFGETLTPHINSFSARHYLLFIDVILHLIDNVEIFRCKSEFRL